MNAAPESPEMKAMRHKTWRRIASLVAIGIMALVAALGRLGIFRIDSQGKLGTLILVAGCAGAVHLLASRSSFLPFLSEAILPPSVLALRTPTDASFVATVSVPAGATHVMYWASMSAAGVAPGPSESYGNFGNSGVVATNQGVASLPLRCPQQYKVRGRTLPRHVHYRAIYPSGIAGEVQTTNVTCL